METLDLGRWKLFDPGWAWVDLTADEPRIFGASEASADDAWAAGVAVTRFKRGEELDRLEALREAGHIELVRATCFLIRAWAQDEADGWKLHDGVAITGYEHGILTGTIEIPLLTLDDLHKIADEKSRPQQVH